MEPKPSFWLCGTEKGQSNIRTICDVKRKTTYSIVRRPGRPISCLLKPELSRSSVSKARKIIFPNFVPAIASGPVQNDPLRFCHIRVVEEKSHLASLSLETPSDPRTH